jgi:spermidine synthase
MLNACIEVVVDAIKESLAPQSKPAKEEEKKEEEEKVDDPRTHEAAVYMPPNIEDAGQKVVALSSSLSDNL